MEFWIIWWKTTLLLFDIRRSWKAWIFCLNIFGKTFEKVPVVTFSLVIFEAVYGTRKILSFSSWGEPEKATSITVKFSLWCCISYWIFKSNFQFFIQPNVRPGVPTGRRSWNTGLLLASESLYIPRAFVCFKKLAHLNPNLNFQIYSATRRRAYDS